MVEHQPSKLDTWVRFPSPALNVQMLCIAHLAHGVSGCDKVTTKRGISPSEIQIMREWLSGGAPPCQGGGRGFDPRLALSNNTKGHPSGCPFVLSRHIRAS